MEEVEENEPLAELADEESAVPEEQPLKLYTLEERMALFQAVVFASTELVTVAKMGQLVEGFDLATARRLLERVNERLASIEAPFEMVEQGGGFRFRTVGRWAPWVRTILSPDAMARRLSQAALETLAIVAYKQPITKVEIETIRGVSCSGPLKSLLDRKLIALGGRAETLGNPFQYVTTRDFLLYFGINKIPDDLPRLHELEDLIRASELLPTVQIPNVLREGRPRVGDDQLQFPMDE